MLYVVSIIIINTFLLIFSSSSDSQTNIIATARARVAAILRHEDDPSNDQVPQLPVPAVPAHAAGIQVVAEGNAETGPILRGAVEDVGGAVGGANPAAGGASGGSAQTIHTLIDSARNFLDLALFQMREDDEQWEEEEVDDNDPANRDDDFVEDEHQD